MQVQIQALLAGGAGVDRAVAGSGAEGSNMGSHIEMAWPPVFNGETGRVGGFITACKLYLKMKMRETIVEEQVQWIFSYV